MTCDLQLPVARSHDYICKWTIGLLVSLFFSKSSVLNLLEIMIFGNLDYKEKFVLPYESMP
ncbi:hypothetical protein CFP56_029324 [Quercus suber]|uniref:Uncharacterized protein n=1 Tax=Quercus suber TaxID=58331 RepID=A0AAW0LVN6_QUESU